MVQSRKFASSHVYNHMWQTLKSGPVPKSWIHWTYLQRHFPLLQEGWNQVPIGNFSKVLQDPFDSFKWSESKVSILESVFFLLAITSTRSLSEFGFLLPRKALVSVELRRDPPIVQYFSPYVSYELVILFLFILHHCYPRESLVQHRCVYYSAPV